MKKKDLVRKITCWLTLGIFTVQPALVFAEDIVADPAASSAQRPVVTEAGSSGIPLVQITAPSGEVSLNRYDSFSVPERGAILNNAFLFANTQLAGYIEGNPNLIGGPARIIVNEVMGRNPSELRGFLEVAGAKASVVIANPNGILADGAGFLNTSRAILATGRSETDAAGNFTGIRVEDGHALITGKGLDARGADSAEIYARAIEINAGIWANHARLAAGANEVGRDGSVTPITADNVLRSAPSYAIDLADIGGMYANRVELVGTEKGLGVNLRGTVSATRAVSLDVNGNLRTSGSLYSDGSAAVRAEDIENHGLIYGDTIRIQAKTITNETDSVLENRLAKKMKVLKEREQQVEEAHRNVPTDFPVIKRGHFSFHQRNLNAAINAYNGKISDAQAAYDAQQAIVEKTKAALEEKPAGVIAARRDLSLSADTIQNSGNALLYSGGALSLTANEELKNHGARIEAQGNMRITAPVITNENAAFAAKRVVTESHYNPTKILINEQGHKEEGKVFPASEFRNLSSGYGAYHSEVPLKPIYEPAAYEKIRPLTPEEIAAGKTPVPEELIGTLAPNYAYDDPIFKELGVASMNTPRPKNGDPAQAAWDTQYQGILAELNEKIAAHNEAAKKYNAPIEEAARQKIHLLTFIETYTQTSEEKVTSSMPGNIRAGGSIELHGDTVNKDSNIIAGGTLHTTGALTQEAKKQQAQTVTLGTTQFSYTRKPPRPRKGRQRRSKSRVFMTPEVALSGASPIGVGLYEGGTREENLTDEQRRRIHNALSPFGLAPDGFAKGNGGEGPEHLLVSALYRVHPESTAKYLIETDPAFTDRRKFLSSDYIYQRLRWDPDKVPKRIGDGFYEQQLFAEQILRRTGKRHLDGYTDDEAAFQALMDAGISYAAEMNIAPGVALTKEQIEALTSDMIWLEEREVYVRGKKERAVYPVLYMKNTNGLRLTAGGSLISAKNISVETTKALKNAGTLYGENIRAHAGDIENEGLILAKDIALTSDTALKTTGTIQGESSVLLDAKESIYAQSTTEKLPHQDVLDQTANISVKNDEGTLLMRAGRNIELTGANLSAQGKNGSIQLTAGNDIVLGTNRLQSEKDMTLDASNYLRTKRGTEFVTEIQADGNVNLAAGNDLNIRAAAIASKNADVSLTAGNDVKITSGEESSEDHYAMRYKERGLFSSKTTTIRTDSEERSALSANISGKNIHISAAKDAELQAANVIADGSANVSAGRDLNLTTAENYARLDHYKEVKKSGIFGSGGLGFTIGTQRTKTDHDREATTQQGTNIAALGGNVSLTAGETAHLTSANVLAGKEASVTAKETTIDGRENVYRESYTKEVKTSGLTVSFGHGLIDLGQEFYAPLKRMGEVEDDRLKAVYAWRTGRLIHDYFGKNALALDKSYTPSLTLSLGSSSSYNRSENVTREYAGSMIRAGELANLTAAERDLTIKGSTVESKDVSLTAKGNVRLEAGENTSVTTTVDKYSSASIGASFGINGLSDISINVNRAKGNSKETYTSYTPALIRAEENAVITSGKDTDILGSKVQGDKVTARVGGNLNIETLQEKETYEEQNTSTGFGISWSMNPLTKHFSKPIIGRDWSKGTIDSHYRSAREQAGFFAGSKGFDIYARENTDLKGGLIASEASPDKNLLSTGTFTFNDLKNEADYRAKDTGSSAQIKPTLVRTKEKTPEGNKIESLKVVQALHSTPSIPTVVQGSADSTTKAAVAPGTIDIRENPAQDISALSRDTANALNELGRIFDKKSVEEQKELVNVFREEAFRLAHNLTDDGSGRKVLIHTIIGGLISQLSGAGFASGAAGAGLNEALINNLKGLNPAIAQVISGVIGAAAAKAIHGDATAGAISAASGTKWNKFSDFYYFKLWKFVWINANNVEYALNNAIITNPDTTEERMRLYMGDGDELHINTGHAYYRDHKSQEGGTIPSFRYTNKKELLTTVINCALTHYAQGNLDKGELVNGNEHVLLSNGYGKRVPVNLRITMIKIGNIFYISDFYPTAIISK
ncbi:hemagglutinin repeat-containing protein [Selenomonas noxia]|uniref:Filamentous haemagglutinin FhaB/tRNA nuclease CdiA-like TPS domain-containing protein n=1 Tax=Selenomonas noxia F0398 TaxID=702437 RepID=A0ABN0DQQ5_9FIRM|nr:hemagglutinin repeat-containing protein [Selenomonas noxia]EHG25164.1 hypothetical protein HMPREF9432_00912 [Selenomonas noxia F0398]